MIMTIMSQDSRLVERGVKLLITKIASLLKSEHSFPDFDIQHIKRESMEMEHLELRTKVSNRGASFRAQLNY